MRSRPWLLIFCLCAPPALAGGNSSVYTPFEVEKTCRQIEQGDEYVFEGAWECKGAKGIGFVQAFADERSYVGFGPNATGSCAYRKTFSRFNSALSPIEWRLKDGNPIAAIERWRVQTDDEGNAVTWLVVTALKGREACHVGYVAGSWPDANATARAIADDEAERFDCANGVPEVKSTAGEPGISLDPCSAFAGE